MAETVIHKLIRLTNHFIEADGYTSARQIRDGLIAEVFPLLSQNMRQELSNVTEYYDVLRGVKRKYRDRAPEVQESMAKEELRHLRLTERAMRDDDELWEVIMGEREAPPTPTMIDIQRDIVERQMSP